MNDYWVVTDKRTGRVICHCGEEQDALRMIMLEPDRVYRKQRFIMEQVINITSTGLKELPGQQGLPATKTSLPEMIEDFLALPQGNQIPVNID
jgi:hypothetical protein